jgi:Cu/Ag efflux pump CusA
MTAGAYELSKEAIAKRMIRSIIQFSVTNKIVIGLFVLGLVIAGIYSLRTLPINSIPDSYS